MWGQPPSAVPSSGARQALSSAEILPPRRVAPSFRALATRCEPSWPGTNDIGEQSTLGYPKVMAVNWLEVAQKMAEAARARVAADRKRLKEILAERQKKQATVQSSSHSR